MVRLSGYAIYVEDTLNIADLVHQCAELLSVGNLEGEADGSNMVVATVVVESNHRQLLVIEHTGELRQQALLV